MKMSGTETFSHKLKNTTREKPSVSNRAVIGTVNMVFTERMKTAAHKFTGIFGHGANVEKAAVTAEIDALNRKEIEIAEHMAATERTSGFQIFRSVVELMELETSDQLADPSSTKTLEDVRRLQGKKQALNAVLAIVPDQMQRGAEAREMGAEA